MFFIYRVDINIVVDKSAYREAMERDRMTPADNGNSKNINNRNK